jgi:preprotein translocase subunit SecD
MKPVRGRLLALGIIVVLSGAFFLPSTPFFQMLPSWWQENFPSKGTRLGLDLQGGMHLVLEVQTDKAVEINLDRTADGIMGLLEDNDIPGVKAKRFDQANVQVMMPGDHTDDEVATIITGTYPRLIQRSSDQEGVLIFGISELEAKRIKEGAVEQALETIRNRVDEFGVAEPLIQTQGLREIVVQLPGIKDPKRALRLIKSTAQLEFKLLDDDHPLARELPQLIAAGQEDATLAAFADRIPEGDEILFERQVNFDSGVVSKVPYLIKKQAVLTGDLLTDARVQIGDFSEPYVSISFDRTGGKIFDRVTAENVQKRMAIILDDIVYSAPVIQERISGGRAQITGAYTTQEAADLAIALRAGALPAPVAIIQNLTVGPSLGRDSIEKGATSMAIAAFLVVAFMIYYYRVSGLIADVALVLNVVGLIGALGGLEATLTLPGIAGIILTIGMGVDSNVLILERIREEIRQEKPVRLAIDAGYNKALLTIVDAHVTTLITGFALFVFGTGPIKGFAVTLCLGIGINLFTALVGTKVVYDIGNNRWRFKHLSI